MDVDSVMVDASDPLRTLAQLLDAWTADLELASRLQLYARFGNNDTVWDVLVAAAKDSRPTHQLGELIFDQLSGDLKSFNPLAAAQLQYEPTVDTSLGAYLAILWYPGELIEPPIVDSQTLSHLQLWIPQRDFFSEPKEFVMNIKAWRRLKEGSAHPPELSHFFVGPHMKLLKHPERQRKPAEDFHVHLAAMWTEDISQIIKDDSELRSQGKDEALADMLFEKMQGPFFGAGDKQFSKGMDVYKRIWKPELYNGRIIAVPAPSGSGKTRLLLEYLNKNAGVFICLRSLSDTAAQGWPPGDGPIIDFFLQNRGDDPSFVSAALLKALVMRGIATCSDTKNLEERNRRWKHHRGSRIRAKGANDQRAEQIRQVAVVADQLVKSTKDAFRKEIRRLEADGNHAPSAVARVAVKAVWDDASIVDIPDSGFVVAIDECTSITHLYPEAQVSPLLRVMESLSDYNIWFLLASTSSKIASTVPSIEVKNSQRFPTLMSLPPWFYLPFEPLLHFQQAENLASALLIKQMQYTGRPLWHIYEPPDVINLAMQKLLNGPAASPFTEQQIFALYTQRICLQLDPSPSSQLMEVQAVESHMRLATGIYAGKLITSCPSEPILALGAAVAMHVSGNVWNDATTGLVRLVAKYRVDRGLEGELYARLVLMMARDTAVPDLKFIEKNSNGLALRPVTLENFWRALLTDVPLELINVGADVHITFTHFLQLTVNVDVLDVDWCIEMLCRGAAAQCTFAQPVIDGIIFGYRGEVTEAFDERKLYLICYQAKARAKAASTQLTDNLTCPMIRCRDGTLYKPEHSVILMDMASHASYRAGATFVTASKRQAKLPTGGANGKHWRGYASFHSGTIETTGYLIGVRGMNGYKVFDGVPLKEQLFKNMHPEGPLEAEFGAASRTQIERICAVIPKERSTQTGEQGHELAMSE